jgi:hypothetical protein
MELAENFYLQLAPFETVPILPDSPPRRPHRNFSLYYWNVFTESLQSNGRGADRSEYIGAQLVAQQRTIHTRTSIVACLPTRLLSRYLANALAIHVTLLLCFFPVSK